MFLFEFILELQMAKLAKSQIQYNQICFKKLSKNIKKGHKKAIKRPKNAILHYSAIGQFGRLIIGRLIGRLISVYRPINRYRSYTNKEQSNKPETFQP